MLASVRRCAAALATMGLSALTGVLFASSPAAAVQTTTWGLVAAPGGHGYRSSISHPANGSTVHDAVVVFNRTGEPITIHLYVLSASFSGSAYQFGPPSSGLAPGVGLAARTVILAGHQQARVPVTIRMPRGVKSTLLAGIGAEAAPVDDGALSIQQQLVVLVKATPTNDVVPVVVRDVGPWSVLALVVLGAVAAGAALERRRVGLLQGAASDG